MRAVGSRPTTLERWPKGVHPGIVVSTREKGGGDAFFQKRVPRGAPEYVRTARIDFPSGRHADEVCPTELAVVAWAAQMGTITFHPWPVRADDVDHPDELRLDLDPQEGTDFADAVRVAAEARGLLGDLGYAGFPKTSGGRGVHIYVRIEPRWSFTEVRHAAIAFGRELERRLPGRGDDEVVEGGARRADLHRLQPERPRPDDRLRLQRQAEAGSAGLGPGDVGGTARGRPGGLHGRDHGCPVRRLRRPPRGDRRRRPLAAAAARSLRARRGRGRGRHALPAVVPEDAGRAQAGAAVADATRARD